MASTTMESPTKPVPSTPPAATDAANPLYGQFVGAWTGQLEYRDFQSDAQVFLPTWLAITADARALQLDFVYDDGPSKIVRERMRLAIADGSAELSSDRDRTHDTYRVGGLEAFAKLGRGVLTLTGTSRENDHPVDVQITLTLRRNLFTLRKETRAGSEPFRFRDGYTFTRATPPTVP